MINFIYKKNPKKKANLKILSQNKFQLLLESEADRRREQIFAVYYLLFWMKILGFNLSI